MYDYKYDEEEEARENPVIMGVEVTPLQIGLALAGLGAVAYYFYSRSGEAIEAPVSEGGIAAISMDSGVTDAESVPADEVAEEVVMPELTKAEWLKIVKSDKAFKELVKALNRQDIDLAKAKIAKVSVVNKPVVFYAAKPPSKRGESGATHEPVVGQEGLDQLLTLAAPINRKGQPLGGGETSKNANFYVLARADKSVKMLGISLLKQLDGVKTTRSTTFVQVPMTAVASKVELTDDVKADVVEVLKAATAKTDILKVNKQKGLVLQGVYDVPADTVLSVDVKDSKGGRRQGAKIFPAGTRLVKVTWKKWDHPTVLALSAEGKVTVVQLMQPLAGEAKRNW